MAGFKITVGGMEIEAESAADVAELIKAIGAKNTPAPQLQERQHVFRKRLIRQAPAIKSANQLKHSATISNMLSALSTKRRIEATEMQHLLDVREPKGVGAKFKVFNQLIQELGFNLEDVYTTSRDREGREWKAGPKISEAIKALKDAA